MLTLSTASGKRVRHYGHRDVVLSFTRYVRNGRTCLRLLGVDHDLETDEVCGVCTVNLPSVPMKDDEVAIKTWYENVGMLDWLVELGIVSRPLRYACFANVFIPICALLIGDDTAPGGHGREETERNSGSSPPGH